MKSLVNVKLVAGIGLALAMGIGAVPAMGSATLLAYFPMNEGSGNFVMSTGGINTYLMQWEQDTTDPAQHNPWRDDGGGFSYANWGDGGHNNLLLAGSPNWYGGYGGSGPLPDADRLNTRMEPAGAVELWYRSGTDQTGPFVAALISHEGNGGGAMDGKNVNSMSIGAGYTSAAGNIAGVLAGNQTGGSHPSRLVTHWETGIGDVPAPLGDWTHVVLTWIAESHARLYVNGELAGSEAAIDFTPSLGIFRSHMGLDGYNAHSNAGGYYPNADMDDVKFWQGELSAGEVLANFQAGRLVPEPASLGLLLSVSALLIWRRRRA
jgi:hypothetical protein